MRFEIPSRNTRRQERNQRHTHTARRESASPSEADPTHTTTHATATAVEAVRPTYARVTRHPLRSRYAHVIQSPVDNSLRAYAHVTRPRLRHVTRPRLRMSNPRDLTGVPTRHTEHAASVGHMPHECARAVEPVTWNKMLGTQFLPPLDRNRPLPPNNVHRTRYEIRPAFHDENSPHVCGRCCSHLCHLAPRLEEYASAP